MRGSGSIPPFPRKPRRPPTRRREKEIDMPVSVKSFTPPTGNTAPALSSNGANFTATFVGNAEFDGAPCANGEYRQYVMGQFKAGGSVLTHYLCPGDALSSIVYKEDGCPASCTAYGHRNCPAVWDNQYTPAQSTGCKYSMSDSPGFSNVQPSTTYSIELYFKGELIDVTAPSPPLISKAWTVIGQTTTPAKKLADTTTSLAGGLQAGDRIVGAHLSKNLDDGSSEVHLVVIRPSGAPALDAAQVPIEIKDGAGQRVRIAGSVAHEITGKGRSTATLVYTLKQNARTPVELEIQGDRVLRLAISLHG